MHGINPITAIVLEIIAANGGVRVSWNTIAVEWWRRARTNPMGDCRSCHNQLGRAISDAVINDHVTQVGCGDGAHFTIAA